MAAPTTIRELLVAIGVKSDGSITKSANAVNALKKGLLAAGAAAVALSGFLFGTAVVTANYGDEAAKASKRIGVNVEALQELRHAAELSGAEFANVETGFRRMGANAFDASLGVGEAAQSFDILRVNVRNAEGQLKSQEALFLEVAQAISETENSTTRVALAQDIFGRSGAKLLPMLQEGADGIARMRAEARALGIVMSEEDTRAAEVFVDTLSDLRKVVAANFRIFAGRFIPAITRIMQLMREWRVVNAAVINQQLEAWGTRVANVLDWMVETTAALVARWKDAKAAIGVMVGALLMAGIALKAMWLPFVVSMTRAGFKMLFAWAPVLVPILAATAAIGGLFLLVDDFLAFMRGESSLLGDFFTNLGVDVDEVREVVSDLWDTVRELMASVLDLTGLEMPAFGAFVETWLTGMRELAPLVAAFVESTITGLRELDRRLEERAVRQSGVSSQADVDAADTTAVEAALRRRAARTGVTFEALQAQHSAGVLGGTETRRREALASGSAALPTNITQNVTIQGSTQDPAAIMRDLRDDELRTAHQTATAGAPR